jgi:sulfoxide reductase heme-binding subunit YedZ
VLFVLCLLPFAWLFYGAFTNQLGANPAEYLIRATGRLDAALPLHRAGGDAAAGHQQARRRWRASAACWACSRTSTWCMHLLSYSWFDMGFDLADIAKDIAKRPFILVGFSAFVLLTPLAATSFNRAIKAMGAKRWQMLHKLVYVIAGLGCCTSSGCARQEQLRRGVRLRGDHRGAAGLARAAVREASAARRSLRAACAPRREAASAHA